MSRFGIRKRLRQFMGKQKPQYTTYTVTYILPNGVEKKVEAEERYTLLMASEALPSPIGTGRRAGGSCPDGRCGLCRVEVVDPTGISEMNDYELQSLKDHVAGEPHEGRPREPAPPFGPNTRLACQAKIIADGGIVQVSTLVDFEALRGEEDGT